MYIQSVWQLFCASEIHLVGEGGGWVHNQTLETSEWGGKQAGELPADGGYLTGRPGKEEETLLLTCVCVCVCY